MITADVQTYERETVGGLNSKQMLAGWCTRTTLDSGGVGEWGSGGTAALRSRERRGVCGCERWRKKDKPQVDTQEPWVWSDGSERAAVPPLLVHKGGGKEE